MLKNELKIGQPGLALVVVAFSSPGCPSDVLADGGSPLPFTEEAVARGIDYMTEPSVPQFGYGAAFVDLDGDRDADLVTLGRSDGRVGVFENDGSGMFIDRSFMSGVPLISAPSGVVAGDYDGDGDQDLYFSNWLIPDRLLRNEGGFHFVDVTVSAGLGDDGPGTGCAWGDYDNDGWLDLYLSNRTDPGKAWVINRLYHNLGNGTFVDVSAALGVDDDFPTFQAIFFDADRDGDADLYLSTDKGTQGCMVHNRLFENMGGWFMEVTESSGTIGCIDSMGVAVGDFLGNGRQDLYCTNTVAGNPLFLNQGNMVFTESAEEAGVLSQAIGWGTVFADFDNDGFQELYVCNSAVAPNRLYRHDGHLPAVDVAEIMNVDDAGLSHGTAVADIDGDGDLDLLVQNSSARTHLYINHEGELHSWMKLVVAGRGANRLGVGAVVEVRVGQTRRIREVIAGSNYKSQNESILHFGLGDAAMVDEVTIMWPGGMTRSVAHLQTGRTWTLYPPEQLGDGDHSSVIDLSDYAMFQECRTGPTPGLLVPGCEMMDIDGDGDVDLVDFGGLQAMFQPGP